MILDDIKITVILAITIIENLNMLYMWIYFRKFYVRCRVL